ncbi:uncharacterized protein LY89DRAFT_777177 [Mollisia scopiformis]|uniref:Uncharacterized protein n=1 Tax=Mollisia scopiformis TaxID=149040 RepID=A0A194XUP4_MOLSC|nr:uncharacterized protein LY89DRAFT_777177 [Mollisia scopiformis]KUJ23427.1 hypothetical protein LY89DRAFT_777177 [Mollisia scopiformis]
MMEKKSGPFLQSQSACHWEEPIQMNLNPAVQVRERGPGYQHEARIRQRNNLAPGGSTVHDYKSSRDHSRHNPRRFERDPSSRPRDEVSHPLPPPPKRPRADKFHPGGRSGLPASLFSAPTGHFHGQRDPRGGQKNREPTPPRRQPSSNGPSECEEIEQARKPAQPPNKRPSPDQQNDVDQEQKHTDVRVQAEASHHNVRSTGVSPSKDAIRQLVQLKPALEVCIKIIEHALEGIKSLQQSSEWGLSEQPNTSHQTANEVLGPVHKTLEPDDPGFRSTGVSSDDGLLSPQVSIKTPAPTPGLYEVFYDSIINELSRNDNKQ